MLSFWQMNRLSTHLLLAFLLLLSQAALVTHDVEHLGSAHNGLCAVYLSQDHSAHSAAIIDSFEIQVLPEFFQADSVDLLVAVTFSAYASRAPPQTIFFS